jgi:ABC-type transport system substrate-binding protein
MIQRPRFHRAGLLILALLIPIFAACGGPSESVVVETVAPQEATPAEEPTDAADEEEPADTEEAEASETGDEEEPTDETAAAEGDEEAEGSEGSNATIIEDEGPTPTPGSNVEEGSWTTPRPIVNELRFRQAFAHCTNRLELIQSVYPFLEEEEQTQLLMNSMIPQGHWAVAADEDITLYPFDPEQGVALLEEAGWTEVGPDGVRMNEDGDRLSVKFTTTNAQFRITWATVLEQQLKENCGIEIVRTHVPGSWWFGARTGLQVRDFELGAYAWVGQVEPVQTTLYSCNQIPLPSNNWEGQNYMGWCNEEASQALFIANNTLDREERIGYFLTLQQRFTEDMVSLPLFNRLEAAAASNNLQNFKPNPTINSNFINIDEWTLEDGGDTVVLGFTQEPASLYLNAESAAVANKAYTMLVVPAVTSYDYDYQPAALTELPTIENGGTTDTVVEVQEGDRVWTADNEAVELAPGVQVLNADGELVDYEGGPLEMRQLAVTFEFVEGLTWEDGVPVTKEDFELSYNINCDPESGAVSLTVCNSIEKVDFTSDSSYTINYLPGARWTEYFAYTLGTFSNLFSVGAYPAHQVLSDGRTLAEVPAREWSTLPEIAEKPLSYGPYKLVSWEKGQRMTFEANPYYYKGEVPIKTVIVQFFDDTNQAVAQLLTGDVDVLDTETLGAGPELETVLAEGEQGTIQAFPITSPTWEHVDFNLFVP